jgi:hypothetical protein
MIFKARTFVRKHQTEMRAKPKHTVQYPRMYYLQCLTKSKHESVTRNARDAAGVFCVFTLQKVRTLRIQHCAAAAFCRRFDVRLQLTQYKVTGTCLCDDDKLKYAPGARPAAFHITHTTLVNVNSRPSK